MSSASIDLVAAAGVHDDDHCKLSFYLHCALVRCGIDNVLQPAMTEEFQQAKTEADAQQLKEAIVTVATGKQFGLKSLSYKTVFLSDDINGGDALLAASGGAHAFLSVHEAVEKYKLQLDPLLLGGMIPVQPKHILVCTQDWVRTFYADPAQRLSNQTTAATPDIRSLFVRTTQQEMQAEQSDMASKLQQMMMMAGGRGGGATPAADKKPAAFSGQGQSLGSGSTTNEAATAGDDSTLFDPQTLPEEPPTLVSDQPITSVAVRTLAGTRQIVKVNLSMTVRDLATHLKKSSAAAASFRLMAGYPPKPLSGSVTIQEAGLEGSQVSMRAAATT